MKQKLEINYRGRQIVLSERSSALGSYWTALVDGKVVGCALSQEEMRGRALAWIDSQIKAARGRLVPASQLKVGDRIYFSFLNAEVDQLVSLPSGATKVYGHFIGEGWSCQPQHFATCTDAIPFTVYNQEAQ